jgi:hypothetical protein
MKSTKILILILAAALAGCVAQMPRAPANILEQIEASEVTAQQLSASIVNLTCTRFEASRCVEPGKAFTPDQGIRYHGRAQEARAALRTAKTLGTGQVGDCLGAKRDQAACLAAARGLIAELERVVLQAEGAKP